MKKVLLVLIVMFAVTTTASAQSMKKLEKLEKKLAKRQKKKDAKAELYLSINKKIGAVADFEIGMTESLFVIRNKQAYLVSGTIRGNTYAIKQRNWKKKAPNYQFFYFNSDKILFEINTGVKPQERIQLEVIDGDKN